MWIHYKSPEYRRHVHTHFCTTDSSGIQMVSSFVFNNQDFVCIYYFSRAWQTSQKFHLILFSNHTNLKAQFYHI
jgi:hypothetical protein